MRSKGTTCSCSIKHRALSSEAVSSSSSAGHDDFPSFVSSNRSLGTDTVECLRTSGLPLVPSEITNHSGTRNGGAQLPGAMVGINSRTLASFCVFVTGGGDPWWSTAAYYMLPNQLFFVEFPGTVHEATSQRTVEDLAAYGWSSWVLATIVYGLLAVTWLGGIALSAFLAYDLGNGGMGRYPLRIPVFRSE